MSFTVTCRVVDVNHSVKAERRSEPAFMLLASHSCRAIILQKAVTSHTSLAKKTTNGGETVHNNA